MAAKWLIPSHCWVKLFRITASWKNSAVAASLAQVPEGLGRIVSAGTLAQCGDAATAQKLIEAEARAHPLYTKTHSIAVPLVAALNSLQHGDGASALTALEAGRRFELGGGPFAYPTY